MPVSDDSVLQENSGTVTANASIAVTLPSGTTAGSTIIVIVAPLTSITTPAAGFVADSQATGTIGLCAYHLSEVAAAQTSWTFTQSTVSDAEWYVAEVVGVDPVDPLDAVITNGAGGQSVSSGSTVTTGTTPLNAGLNVIAFAAWVANQSSSWSAQTHGFAEVADVGLTGSSLAVGRTFLAGTTSTFESTATYTGAAGTARALIVAYRAADTPINSPLLSIAGFEWGTHGGMGNSTPSNPQGAALGANGTWGTNYLVQAGSARSGGYGFRVASAASLGAMSFAPISPSVGALSVGFNVRVVSGSGVVVVAQFPLSTPLQLVYDTATTKFGLRWGAGTASYQSGTTALSTWVWVDIRARSNVNPWHADWRIETGAGEYTDQTSPADNAAAAASWGTSGTFTLGLNLSTQTMTADYDDVVVSRYFGAYPLGPHTVRLVGVDPAGTPSVSGTTGNFSTFTANGTLAAWNATTARDAVDEVPPTVSASADGVVQTTTAATDYMQFPMATYTCTSTEMIAAVKMYAALWSGTGAGAGDLAVRGWDGTTETALATVSQITPGSPTAVASLAPLWRSAMWLSVNGWTQAELDAAALRVGFSGDATPDMGVSAIYLEVATRPALTGRQLSVEDDLFTADLNLSAYTSSSLSYVVTSADPVRGVTFDYSLAGVPQTPVYVGPSASTTVTINADNFGDVSDVKITPDTV